jgi:hypothetical protein
VTRGLTQAPGRECGDSGEHEEQQADRRHASLNSVAAAAANAAKVTSTVPANVTAGPMSEGWSTVRRISRRHASAPMAVFYIGRVGPQPSCSRRRNVVCCNLSTHNMKL